MLKSTDLLVAGLATAALTLGLAAAQARDVKAPATTSKIVEVIAPAAPTPERVEAAQVAAESIVQGSPCGRKVKVVYAGYGESDRACAAR